ncbi:hypothetical protein Agub_g15039, partial [Astrephomene gubernaculifera]
MAAVEGNGNLAEHSQCQESFANDLEMEAFLKGVSLGGDGDSDEEADRLLAAEQAAEELSEEELHEMESGPKDWQRFYMDYHQRFVNDCVLQLRGGKVCVRLAQAPSAKCANKQQQQQQQGRSRQQQQQQQGQQKLDKDSDPALTGTTVWDGAVVLSHFLTETAVLVRPADSPYAYSGGRLPAVLELGAGTGGVSLSLAACRLAASVTATDLPDLLPHLRTNVERNKHLLPPPPPLPLPSLLR